MHMLRKIIILNTVYGQIRQKRKVMGGPKVHF